MTEVDPSNVKAHFRKGLALYNLKKYDDALRSFEQAESIDGSFSGKNYHLVSVHLSFAKTSDCSGTVYLTHFCNIPILN